MPDSTALQSIIDRHCRPGHISVELTELYDRTGATLTGYQVHLYDRIHGCRVVNSDTGKIVSFKFNPKTAPAKINAAIQYC
jgi:hypothetical protein